MGNVQVGNRYKVYIEDARGRIIEVPAIAASITAQADMVDATEWGDSFRRFMPTTYRTRIELEAIGDVKWLDTDTWREGLQKRQAAPEWKCDYCGRPNKRERETCASCGAVRSFIYGVSHE